MKSITEYINESIRLDEAKKVRVDDVLKGLDKIDKWSTEDNIKKLIDSYMSAGDVEEFKKEHWTVCKEIVDTINTVIRSYAEDNGDKIDIGELTDHIAYYIEDDDSRLDKWDKEDKEGDWDVDACIDLFNTVSMKVCKEVWLI